MAKPPQAMSSFNEPEIISIEQEERLVVLARTLDTRSAEAREALERAAGTWRHFGSTCLGRALYRHHSIFKSQSDAPVWSHAELVYFRDIVPGDVVAQLVSAPQPPGVRLLRAEILVTTPGSFVFPRGWAGSSHRPDRKPSLEYLDVDPSCLRDYREIMRRYIGPAASKLVAMGKLGTFRTMETAAVLVQDPALGTTWNQIHLSEVEADGFQGFGREFDAALRDSSPDGGFVGVFAGLDKMRTIPRWTLNDPVVEADAALGQWSMATQT
ncbi:hypothetical protein [Bosea sp. BK604]|uniref:hypothetical protein n=1 Tax=Bosea sp. BK604 TaxID=2512180 RepID=UPI00104DA255|nr:hypothetical protein [Bosea sp. BK604]TCR65746.1 hypothetical protein EV560_105509 [Bosea sp. BK604]